MYERRVSEYVFHIDSEHTWNESRFYKQWHSMAALEVIEIDILIDNLY